MIYLDNAATSYPKPESVYRAVANAVRKLGGNPSRSGHKLSAASGDAVFECREKIAKMFGADEDKVVFCENATHALNTAIKGIAKSGDHFIISNTEHNAVLRPIIKLCEESNCEYDTIDIIDKKYYEITSNIASKIRKNTRAVVMNHVSNLCPVKIPVREICFLCQKYDMAFILDASQSAGHFDIDIKRDKINFLCAPAHKGMYGIMGLGFLISDGKYELSTLTEGGSGYNSASPHMPINLPEHLEAGTLPVPAIAALSAGCDFVSEFGIENISSMEKRFYLGLCDRLSTFDGIKIYRKEDAGACLLFNLDRAKSDSVGQYLSDKGICVRSGFHCSPLGHKSLETGEYGAVRVSFGAFNTFSDLDALYLAMKEAIFLHYF